MVAGCGMKIVKFIVFIFNFLFFALGATAIGLGIWALVDDNNMLALTKIDSSGKLSDYNAIGLIQSGAIVLIVGGSILLLIGFFGCCGACMDNTCLLTVYAVVVVIIIIIEAAAAGIAIAFRGKIEDSVQSALKNLVEKDYDGQLNSSNPFSRAFDFVQIEFKCCGVQNASEFKSASKWTPPQGDNVPLTCCKLNNAQKVLDSNKISRTDLEDQNCPAKAIGSSNPNTGTPCFQAIEDWMMKHIGAIIGIAIGIVFVEIFAIVFACCLIRAIKDEGK